MKKPKYKEFHNYVEPVIKNNKVKIVTAFTDGEEVTTLLDYTELRELADYLESLSKPSHNNNFTENKSSPKSSPQKGRGLRVLSAIKIDEKNFGELLRGKRLKKFINIDNGKLFAQIIAIVIMFTLAIFTPMQTLDFSLKIFIMIGVIITSVWVMRKIECHFTLHNSD